MSIDRVDFDAVSESDLAELVDGLVPEELRLEYKAVLYRNDEDARNEALKDISAFANAYGGHLIIGISQDKGLPSKLIGLDSTVDVDKEILRLEQLAQTGIEPRIQGLRIRAIRMQDGRHGLVLRIPRSWQPPHRVSRKGVNKFWVRNSAGVHEASVDELRTLFTLGANAQQLATQHRDTRLRAMVDRLGSVVVNNSSRAVLQMVPLASVTTSLRIDLAKAKSELRENFCALAHDGRGPHFTLDGMVVNAGKDGENGQTILFRDGTLEATLTNIVNKQFGKVISAKWFEEAIFTALPRYLAGMQALDIPPPIAVFLTLIGVNGAAYAVSSSATGARIDRTIAMLPACLIEAYGSGADYSKVLQPAFDALWNTTDHARAESFSEDGVWSSDYFGTPS